MGEVVGLEYFFGEVNPDLCASCITCEERCSLRAVGEVNPAMARIKIERIEGGLGSNISFSEDCDNCGTCATYCPYGALSL